MASLKDFNHIDLLYPSKYLKSADLRGKRVPVVIESIDPRGELQGKNGRSEHKPVARLRGKEKMWVIPKTNAKSIAKVHGPEAMNWIGKTVVLYGTTIQAGGEEVDAIRVDEAATRKHLESSPRANGNSKQAQPARGEPRHDPNTDAAPDSSSDDFADIGDPPMSEEQQTEFGDAMANDDRRAAGT